MDAQKLKAVPLFADLSRRKLKIVAQHADEIDLPKDTKLVEEGRLAYELFVLLEGEADVLDGGTVISQLGPGDVVGEIGVLETVKRTATVVTTTPVKAAVMYSAELRALDKALPGVFTELQGLIRERLGEDQV